MKHIGETATAVDPSQTQSTDSSERYGSESEIAEWAKVLIGAYRTTDADDPEIYAAHIRRILSRFPLWVVKKAAVKIPEEIQWLPAPAEVRKTCEAIYLPIVREREREARIQAQLAARAFPKPENAKQTYEELCAEMKARGMPLRQRDYAARQFDVAAFKAKFGMDEATWNQIPNRVDHRASPPLAL